MAERSALAPAKVNLFLHVGPVDGDGYHPLASLVAFADVGDRVTITPADRLSLTVEGPFAAGLEGPGDNLILRALRALGQAAGIGEPPLAVTLDKRLPIAAGLGGGSSDAGAALKLARELLGLTLSDDALADIAAAIGADGPMCLHARAAWAEGRGDRLSFEPRLPPLPALLINPGVASPTGEVYRAFDTGSPAAADRPSPPAVWDTVAVIDWLAAQRNDLQAAAVARAPAIGEAIAAAGDLPGARLVRMSGSGATVFALFETPEAAAAAARRLTTDRPQWWITPANLG
ncbi:4-(cytidine 5'-diphospho)-2-C-methyl-D-erythritol kinase [Roseibacterium beibuensis]|uniref:4-(cytidine 5'-diphospho)-2-C-methyl-D-erythritol kinase n=1 Tax=[Roseibacterium] beibuensis TaxID=1193142 RepID=UPI00217EC9AC|nr:4-(cytidine 5'-diphospho)-2-C-methyl-D-erythritol kinase [Roseibacterium beibuensis]MCS6622713.1 4-(cytidine 5'-diphospho)-2-C-methyl-D-erythritol kinase [Roseibacterium beibuensis]